MNTEALLRVLNIAGAALDLADQYNISEQKFLDLRKSKNGAPLTAGDLTSLSKDSQAAIDSIKG